MVIFVFELENGALLVFNICSYRESDYIDCLLCLLVHLNLTDKQILVCFSRNNNSLRCVCDAYVIDIRK